MTSFEDKLHTHTHRELIEVKSQNERKSEKLSSIENVNDKK